MTDTLTERPGDSRLSDEERDLVRAHQQRAQRRWVVRMGALIAALSIALAGVVVVVFTDTFVVKTVEVRGDSLEVPKSVVDPAIGNVVGARLATLDVSGIRDRLAALSAVADVSVTRSWPDRLLVKITPRTPVVAVHIPGRRDLAVVDKSGFAYRWATNAPPGVPEAYVAGPAGQRSRTLAAVAAVAQGVDPQPWLADRVLSLSAVSPDSVTVNLNSKVKVMIGSPDDLNTKLGVLQPLMKRPARLYDVSAPAMPVTR